MSTPTRAVFLDRDGVINEMCYDPDQGTIDSPMNPEQFRLIPEVSNAIIALRALGFRLIVVSNQPGIAKGKMRTPLLEAITAKMHEELGATGASVDAVYYCPHHPSAIVSEYRIDCPCRKPRPGLLLRAAATLGIDCGASYLIGDGLTDIAAGRSAGCATVWIGNFRCDVCRVMDRLETRPDYVAQSLPEAVEIIAKREELNGTR